MNKKVIVSLLIILVILLFFSVLSYLLCHKNFANYLLDILIAIGTCGAVIQALYLSIPQKENIEGYCQFNQQIYTLLLV